ncbi:Glycerol-3-phosphate transporter [Fimbriiglobus ruber]|uniref:Glycerol-3-phosphate transporter n=1 Tax=Fimbriiglobus ruber TaxID=1908690 RepID=A0A225DCN4_9BACT|nr:Glycerol-3-phosphate transporter [Fimbriiglobus ruber]
MTLLTGYAGYYICRSNWAVAKPLMLEAFKDQGITKAELGDVESVALLAYAGGKLLSGVVTDFLGGRGVFLFGMIASAVCTVMFGFAGGLTALFVVAAANRFVQSMGWGGLVQVTGRWFPAGTHGTVLGILSMSYLLGDAIAKVYLGLFARTDNWQDIFFISAATLAVVTVGCYIFLKSSPTAIGAVEPPPNPANVFGDAADGPPPSVRALVVPLLTSTTFWLVCFMNGGLTLIRETFRSWTPTYLKEVQSLSPEDASLYASLLSFAGAAAAFGTGCVTDLFRGRFGVVMAPMLAITSLGLAWLAMRPGGGSLGGLMVLLCTISFFVLGPYTLCSGVLALGLGGKRGGATAAGVIDTAGYLAGTLAGSGIGRLAEAHGWSTAFAALAGVAAGTFVITVVYALHERSRRPLVRVPVETT